MGFGYQSGIGELIYVLVTCCPDISYAVVCCTQNSVCQAEIHYHAVKYILKYLYLTKDDGIHYWRTTLDNSLSAANPPLINSTGHDLLLDGPLIHNAFNLHSFVASDWATCPKTGCSFIGVWVHLAGGAIAYKLKIQPTLAQSLTEAKFMGASDFGRLILFICSVLWDIGVPQAAAACIAMAMAQKSTSWTCHMDITYHALIEWVECNLLSLERIDILLNMAAHFTKQLGGTLFHRHVDYILGKVPPPYSSVYTQFKSNILNPHLTHPLPSSTDCPTTSPPIPHQFTAVAAFLHATWSYTIDSTYWRVLGISILAFSF